MRANFWITRLVIVGEKRVAGGDGADRGDQLFESRL